MTALTEFMKEGHKPLHDKRHWYIQILATDPSAQGRGVGTELLNFIGALANEEKVPVYLESAGKANEEFCGFRSFGFRLPKRVH